MGRFILIVCMSFATAFVGVSWTARGFPMSFSSPIQVAPLQKTVDVRFDDHAKEGIRKDWEAEHTSQGDDDPKRNTIRMDTLQAANAYAMSPCDKTTKANLIEALSVYVRAWQTQRGCKRNMLGMISCSDQKLEEAADAINTPLDHRVMDALHAAFKQRGIMTADFPDDVQEGFNLIFAFSGPDFGHDQSPICLPRQRGSAAAPALNEARILCQRRGSSLP